MRRTLIMSVVLLVLLTPKNLVSGSCGDVNNSGSVNIADITYLIRYIFQSGQQPICEETGSVTDIDGNIYKTVKIGNQWWMSENLRVTRYQNGDSIHYLPDSTTWRVTSNGAYCNINNDECNAVDYGRLYNWYAASDNRNVAPAGWHVPSDTELKQLELYLGMSPVDVDATGYRGVAGGKLKETGLIHWIPQNVGATNESGFTAIPAGYRNATSSQYTHKGRSFWLWSSTDAGGGNAWFRLVAGSTVKILRTGSYVRHGHTIRCVKD